MDTAATAKKLGPLPEWNLADLYASPEDPAFAADMRRGEEDAKAFAETYKGKLSGLAGGDLAKAIKAYEALSDLLGRAGSYAQLYYVGDTTDPARAKFYGDASAKLTNISTVLLFFELELNKIADDDLAEKLKVPALAHYRPWIDNLRMEKPYQLDDKIEELFLEKSQTGYSAWNRLFDESLAEMRFTVDGEELSLEPTLTLMMHPDETKRKAGAEALAQTFKKNLRLFTHITNTLAKDKEISDRWRGFKDIADARHLSNRVEPEVVAALVEAVRTAYPRLSHRYYQMKAKWLGKAKLDHWDRNAPLPHEDTREVAWEDAKATVLDAYKGFAPEMAEIAGRFFDKRWIDAPVRPGKTSGAFAHPTVPSAHPYVLLNYMGKTRDVMTLAHELGHGVHQVLAADQGALMAQTPLTLAETASVFGEMLTFQALLKQATDPKKRKAMLAGKVEDMLNTVVRQIAFYTFERKIHTARKEGELTADQINALWLEVQGESLGSGIAFSEGYETFWVYVSHFIHSPFYVYAYAFGDCLVNSLYARYQESAEGFQDKYFTMLKAGGTQHHTELLKPFGLDASDPAFWQKGLKVIEGFIDELEAMEAA
ncbi:M3 family oligoendopeptidase [Aestuariivirga sp. YIM B02566]|uniref:M3 family oligoendopeptidase n=1 Tax=Taklimakanibacter albus TaxID=2800327 RepID=A0ACC5R5Q6_9HYPH|nr:M3 family oligoendopeptidase [Aestuariivirga sp. YIM B02566]MBK1867831.1 M3 family oligoendopeptidase [Aestuariivirga sp. YIM B02566]